MSYSVGTGTTGLPTDVAFGAREENLTVAFDLGAWHSDHDGSLGVVYAQILLGGWFESGRFSMVPSLGLGVAERCGGHAILNVDHQNVTVSVSRRAAFVVRVLRTTRMQPPHEAVNIGVGIEGQAFATLDRETLAAVTFTMRLWGSYVEQ